MSPRGRQQPGKLTKVVSKKAPDLDVIKARRLAHLLTQLADRLEGPRADLEAGARSTIQCLHDAWRGLEASSGVDARRRDSLLNNCALMGPVLRDLSRRPGATPNFEDNVVDMAVGIYANDVPEHRALVLKHRALAVDLIRAHARVKGAPRVAAAAEALCKAMGFPVSYKNGKRVARRRRATKR